MKIVEDDVGLVIDGIGVVRNLKKVSLIVADDPESAIPFLSLITNIRNLGTTLTMTLN